MIKSHGISCTQIVLDFDLKVARQCLIFPCHWLIDDMFEHPTPMNSNTLGDVPREDCEIWWLVM